MRRSGGGSGEREGRGDGEWSGGGSGGEWGERSEKAGGVGGEGTACEEGQRKGERSDRYSLSSVYLTHVLPVPGGWSSTAGPGPP